MWSKAICALLLAAGYAQSQTITTTNALGQTVVEAITVDPLGAPSTQTLLTITTTPTPDGQGGPVGQPGTTNTGVTVYTYTTTDVNGGTIAVEATFSPTFPASSTPTLGSGSIWAYSDYTAMYGTGQGQLTPISGDGSHAPCLLASAFKPIAVGALAMACGALLVFS